MDTSFHGQISQARISSKARGTRGCRQAGLAPQPEPDSGQWWGCVLNLGLCPWRKKGNGSFPKGAGTPPAPALGYLWPGGPGCPRQLQHLSLGRRCQKPDAGAAASAASQAMDHPGPPSCTAPLPNSLDREAGTSGQTATLGSKASAACGPVSSPLP